MRSRAWFGALIMILIVLPVSGREPNESGGQPQNLPASRLEASTLGIFARAFDWELSEAFENVGLCTELLGAMRRPALLGHVQPIIESDNEDDQHFQLFKQCRAVREKFARADVADTSKDFASLAAFGDHRFQLYSLTPTVAVGQNSRRPLIVLYGEFLPQNLGGNANMDGYSVVEFANCRVLGNVAIQRPLSGDLPMTPRDFLHGLFLIRGHTWLLVASEEVGKRYDPSAYRAITGYRLEASGELIPACGWHPSEIVK